MFKGLGEALFGMAKSRGASERDAMQTTMDALMPKPTAAKQAGAAATAAASPIPDAMPTPPPAPTVDWNALGAATPGQAAPMAPPMPMLQRPAPMSSAMGMPSRAGSFLGSIMGRR
jgi:hypothetical protein